MRSHYSGRLNPAITCIATSWDLRLPMPAMHALAARWLDPGIIQTDDYFGDVAVYRQTAKAVLTGICHRSAAVMRILK